MITTYRPLKVPGVYIGKETFLKANVPLERALIMVRYALPSPDEIVKYARRMAKRVLETYQEQSESATLAEAIMRSFSFEMIREIIEGDRYTPILRRHSPVSESAIDTSHSQVLQTKVMVLTPDIAATLKTELKTGRDYNYASIREDVAESPSGETARILMSLKDWKLPARAKMEALLEDRVLESDPLTILQKAYPYAEIEEMVRAIYHCFNDGRRSVEAVEDISPDLTDQYTGQGLEHIYALIMKNKTGPRVTLVSPKEVSGGIGLLTDPRRIRKNYGPN